MGAAAAPFAVTTGLQLYSGMMQARAARQAGAAQQRYYNFLADQSESRAGLTLKRGGQQITSIQDAASFQDKEMHREVSKLRGSQRAGLGASGVTADSVTAEDISRDTTNAENIDETAIRFDADSKSWSAATAAEDAASALRDQARQLRMAGESARTAGGINASASLLDTATSVGQNWFNWNMTSMGRTPKDVTRPSGGFTPYRTGNRLSLYG